jgi:hypothetical protein
VGASKVGFGGWEWAFIHSARGFGAVVSVRSNGRDESGLTGHAHALWATQARCRAYRASV